MDRRPTSRHHPDQHRTGHSGAGSIGGPSPDRPAADGADSPRTAAIARAARRLGAGEAAALEDETGAWAVQALMGPEAVRVAEAAGAGALNALGYFRHGEARIACVPVRGARLSYVGEPGWEITCPADRAGTVYDALHAAGARPAGLLAQASMRIEKRFPAYGPDLDTGVTPCEAGLDFAVHRDSAGGVKYREVE